MTWVANLNIYSSGSAGQAQIPGFNDLLRTVEVHSGLIDTLSNSLQMTVELPQVANGFSSSSSAYIGGGTSGDAAFANDNSIMRQGISPPEAIGWMSILLDNLVDSLPHSIKLYGGSENATRHLEARIGSSGDVLAINTTLNTTEVIAFHDVYPQGGVIDLQIRTRPGDSDARLAAMQVSENESTDPAITITSALPITPGSTVTGTYANYNVIPTGATFSDGVEGEAGVNTLSTATAGQLTAFSVTNTDDAGVHSGTFSFVTPSLPSSGNRQMIKFGANSRVRLF